MNKVEDVKLQHELFNQNREKVGNTQYLLHDDFWTLGTFLVKNHTEIKNNSVYNFPPSNLIANWSFAETSIEFSEFGESEKSLNWNKFNDHVCYLCLAAYVVISSLLMTENNYYILTVGCVMHALYLQGSLSGGILPDTDPLDRDPPGQSPPGQRHALDRDPLDRGTPGQTHALDPLDRDPWTETCPEQRPPGQRTPRQTPRQRPPDKTPQKETPLDRDPLDGDPHGTHTGSNIIQTPPVDRMTDMCKNIPLPRT